MVALLLAAALPAIYWDHGPDATAALRAAGVESVYVPSADVAKWKAAGIEARPFDERAYTKVPAPGITMMTDRAAATSAPWIDANGWRFERDTSPTYYYDAGPGKAALCQAEAYAYGAKAIVRPAAEDLETAGRMLEFLRRVDQPRMPELANIGLIDDGSEDAAEVMNLLARRNLLFAVVHAPDAQYDLTIRLGSPEYPREQLSDPSDFAQRVRQKLTDQKRLVRIFGSQVVLFRLEGEGGRARLHLLNYSGRRVEGLRVRVRGGYHSAKLAAAGVDDASAMDVARDSDALEFTVPLMNSYAVVDLN